MHYGDSPIPGVTFPGTPGVKNRTSKALQGKSVTAGVLQIGTPGNPQNR